MIQVNPQRNNPGLMLRMLLPIIRWFWPRVGTPLHVRWYRLLGGRLAGGGVMLLTTMGRRSGKPRTVIIGYWQDDEDLIVTDTNVTKPSLPAWELNLLSNPEAEVRVGREQYQARAEFLEGEERASHWDRVVAKDPDVNWVQRLVGREMSVIRLRRI